MAVLLDAFFDQIAVSRVTATDDEEAGALSLHNRSRSVEALFATDPFEEAISAFPEARQAKETVRRQFDTVRSIWLNAGAHGVSGVLRGWRTTSYSRCYVPWLVQCAAQYTWTGCRVASMHSALMIQRRQSSVWTTASTGLRSACPSAGRGCLLWAFLDGVLCILRLTALQVRTHQTLRWVPRAPQRRDTGWSARCGAQVRWGILTNGRA